MDKMKELCMKMIESYKRDIEFDDRMIAYANKYIELSRKNDSEVLEYIKSKLVDTLNCVEQEIYESGKYESPNTKRELGERQYWYRQRKKDKKLLAEWEAKLKEVM